MGRDPPGNEVFPSQVWQNCWWQGTLVWLHPWTTSGQHMSRALPLFSKIMKFAIIFLKACTWYSLLLSTWRIFNLSKKAGVNPTFISPIRNSVHHTLLLIGGCETQRLTGHARLVVDITVKHIGLARAAETDSANPLSKSVWLQAPVSIECQTP